MKRLILLLIVALALVASIPTQARGCEDKTLFASRSIYSIARWQHSPCSLTIQLDSGYWLLEGTHSFMVTTVSGDCHFWRGFHLTPRRSAIVTAVIKASNRCVIQVTADTNDRWRARVFDVTDWGQ